MRILLTAKHAPHGKRPIGGVQTWCRTVEAELLRRGHEVVTWGPELPMPSGAFDLGVISNAADCKGAIELCARTVSISHGIISPEEPHRDSPVAFTSEEVRDHWGGGGTVLRQPIDLTFWSPSPLPRDTITRHSYRAGLAFVKEIARSLGKRYAHLRRFTAEEVRDYLQRSFCVLATGRAALEAMACGVPVVICDHRSAYQPALLEPHPVRAMVRNYSGRGGIQPTLPILEAAVEDAVARGSLREHVQKHHDVRNVTTQLLELAT